MDFYTSAEMMGGIMNRALFAFSLVAIGFAGCKKAETPAPAPIETTSVPTESGMDVNVSSPNVTDRSTQGSGTVPAGQSATGGKGDKKTGQ
jgi:hypothetical protein